MTETGKVIYEKLITKITELEYAGIKPRILVLADATAYSLLEEIEYPNPKAKTGKIFDINFIVFDYLGDFISVGI